MSHPAPVERARRRRPARSRRLVRATLFLLVALAGGTTILSPTFLSQASASTSQYRLAVLADGPTGWYRLDESSGTVAVDSTGHRAGRFFRGPTLGAPAVPESASGTSVAFDGVDDFVAVPSRAGLSPRHGLTVEAWIHPASVPRAGRFASIVTKAGSWSLQLDGPRLDFTLIRAGVARHLLAPAGTVVAGGTYHVVGTFRYGDQRLYLNGSLVAARTHPASITGNGNPVTIGAWGGWKRFFDGAIDEVAVYDAGLSATRVKAHWVAGTKPWTEPGRDHPRPTPTPIPTIATTASPDPATDPPVAPTPTLPPTPTDAPSATPAPTPTASPTSTATATASATATATATVAPTPTPTVAPTATPSPTRTPAPTAVPTPTPPSSDGPRKGAVSHFMWQSMADTTVDLDRMQAAGMRYVRFDMSWRNSESTKGTYKNLDMLDQVISAVQARGMALTISVIETPGWANGGGGMFAPPSNPADYASFMGVLAKRYATRPGMVWEIWNEENDAHFWTTGPNVAQYTAMLKAAYAAIKANDPDATVLVGGILFNDTAFLNGIYANGGGTFFDGIAIHPYSISRPPGDTSSAFYGFANSVPQFTTVLASHGQGSKLIWITEFGWSTTKVSDATRATYFRDALTIAKAWTNVPGIGAYTLRQTQTADYGLFTSTGVATASWNALAAAN